MTANEYSIEKEKKLAVPDTGLGGLLSWDIEPLTLSG
jgi:hypothetical protein